MVIGQDSVLLPTPAQQDPAAPAPQGPVVAQPPVVAGPVVAAPVIAGPQPVWFIQKKFLGHGYRAKPGWINVGCCAAPVAPPVIAQPVMRTVMVPMQVQTYVYRAPQPVTVVRPEVRYRAETYWRY